MRRSAETPAGHALAALQAIVHRAVRVRWSATHPKQARVEIETASGPVRSGQWRDDEEAVRRDIKELGVWSDHRDARQRQSRLALEQAWTQGDSEVLTLKEAGTIWTTPQREHGRNGPRPAKPPDRKIQATTVNTPAQWKIERVKRDAHTLVLTCQGDLRKLAGALEQDKVLLKEMRFDLRNQADLDQAGAIGMATRGDRSLPYEEDLERWTGTEFVWRPGGLGRHGIEKPADRGQYRLWLPPSAMKLYEKVALGKDLGLCIPGTTFIGGGTILVAKWRHRTSKDIDIFRKAPEWEESVEKARIDQWLERINERPLEKKTTRSFSKVEWKEGDTDFGQTPFLRPNSARDPIVGTVLTACTTEEILAGKIAGRAIVPLRERVRLGRGNPERTPSSGRSPRDGLRIPD